MKILVSPTKTMSNKSLVINDLCTIPNFLSESNEINNALKNKRIPLYGDGLHIRDWLFVEDHIDALLIAANKGIIGESYCVGGNQTITNLELVEKICKFLDVMRPKACSYKNLINFVIDRPGHDKKYSINPKKINTQLRWESKLTLSNGLKETIKWYLKNHEWIENKKLKSINYP